MTRTSAGLRLLQRHGRISCGGGHDESADADVHVAVDTKTTSTAVSKRHMAHRRQTALPRRQKVT